jgi:hypothetical protein
MGELLRHRHTKAAETDMFAPKVTAPHLDSTEAVMAASDNQRPERAETCRWAFWVRRTAVAALVVATHGESRSAGAHRHASRRLWQHGETIYVIRNGFSILTPSLAHP